MNNHESTRKWILIAVFVVLIVVILTSISFRREPIPNVPSEYSFGTLAPIISLNQSQLATDNRSTAQIVYLGQKPLLRIENMNITQCPDTFVFLSRGLTAPTDTNAVSLGNVRFSTGHTNYEINGDLNISSYNTVNIWCAQTNALLGYANLG